MAFLRCMFVKSWVIGLVATVLTFASHAQGAESIEVFLQRFHTNPGLVIRERPARTGAPVSRFSQAEISSREFVIKKDEWRARRATTPAFAAPIGRDLASRIVDAPHLMTEKIHEIEQRGLLKGSLAKQAWSGDYWPHYRGLLSHRYADPSFPRSYDWLANFNYVAQPGKTLNEIFHSGDSAAIQALSPAEKYDLLIGRVDGPMSSLMWNHGRKYYDKYGQVAEWMGICEGWATAALMLERPTRAVSVLAADGKTEIIFFPHDIKALASALWAWGSFAHHGQVGSRCNTADPATDANGRIVDPECFDVNPATVHLALTHQVGANRGPLIMDSIFDYEVWNQPIQSYQYSYFNPQTMVSASTLTEAKVGIADFSIDKFKAYRSPAAVAVIGISLDLTYVAEDENPQPNREDDLSRDVLRSVRYVYDLELDVDGRIIGGEWYNHAHPDFFWRPKLNARAVSQGDAFAQGEWPLLAPLPASWVQGAQRAAPFGQPLAKIVEELIRRSGAGQ